MLLASINTRVARRILLLLLVATLLPTGAALLVADTRIRDELVAQSLRNLRQTAEWYAIRVYDRLVLAESALRALAGDDAGRAWSLADGQYSAIGLIHPDPARTRWHGAAVDAGTIGEILRRRPAAGTAAILPLGGNDGERSVWVVGAVDATSGGPVAALKLDARLLWGDADELPYLTDTCVLDALYRPLYCSAALSEEAIGRIAGERATSAKGSVQWTADGVDQLSVYREIFLTGRFGAPGWTVVVTQPAAHAFAATGALRDALIPAVTLGLLLSALIGLWQVRKTLTPLRDLAGAARRIGERDFSARVAIAPDDEFGELAQAFNAMSTRLGGQFDALQTLAMIDREILTGSGPGAIAEACLTSVLRQSPSTPVALLLEDVAPGRDTHTLWTGAALGDPVLSRGATPDAAALAALCVHAEGISLGPDAAAELGLCAAIGAAGVRLFVQPVVGDDRVVGLFAIAPNEGDPALAPPKGLLRDLAARIAVAATSAQRREKLRLRAMYDPLTGLPNRAHILERLDEELEGATRAGTTLGLLFVDLDGFSGVNDSLGHTAGDQLLRSAGQRLSQQVSAADVVGRLGGDEFVVLLRDLPEHERARSIANRIVAALAVPFEVASAEVFISASVGIAFAPEHASNATDLLRAADLALYEAKSLGRGSSAAFDRRMTQEVERRTQLDRELREALAKGQFELQYEPLINTRDGRVRAAEALIRWRHPLRGLVPPLQFISVAEDSGLIVPIGDWVLHTACAQFMAWRRAGVRLESISVNVSAHQFRRPDFVDGVLAALAGCAMPADALQLEITESVLIDDKSEIGPALARLAGMGVELAIDDFGTGYSSLSYLQRLPVGTIKIDRSFVREIETRDDARALAHAAIEMAHALGKRVVAEGVEFDAQRVLLAQWDCELLQGWLFTRPLGAAEFESFVRAREGVALEL
ncbi:MAG: EAL domain-containing protein [Burkholderiaceae bacterium]|nr:EAL domain-containing protein [Burkholderiaceae bacterium]